MKGRPTRGTWGSLPAHIWGAPEFWPKLGFPGAPSCHTSGSLLGGMGWREQPCSWGPKSLVRFRWARQAPKDTLVLTTTVGQGPGRIRGRSGSGRGGPGPGAGGLLPAAPHAPFHSEAAAQALS